MKMLHRTLRVLSAIIIAICSIVALGDLAGAASSTTKVKVTRTIDGDTIVVNGTEKVRLLGVDTPETVSPWKPTECGGPEASRYTKQALLGKTVTITKVGHDKYGRTLAYVDIDGKDHGLRLIKAGLAREYTYKGQWYSKFPKYKYWERRAILTAEGIWGNC
jgi:micrococcal nuclease